MEKILNTYIETLKEAGAGSAKVIKKVDHAERVATLNTFDKVTVPQQLEILLSYEYDDDLCYEFDYNDPEFAWSMYLLSFDEIQTTYENLAGLNGDDCTYFPLGFVPILGDFGGSFVVVNCIKNSPTYGAVYNIGDGVGANMLATDLAHFFKASTEELTQKLRFFEEPELSDAIDARLWFEGVAKIFGNTPYFSRKGNMDQQIIDWI
ncbi:SMI1_KNR4 domain-containing protein [Tenacibaculum sp. 190130A14a]|uniref:SMI1_KNR4 domain-containing protein n=1 Tax=Tenacibaculum polynesiense TaxID=3137857 RepID=A0ABM9PDN2_9FLAO